MKNMKEEKQNFIEVHGVVLTPEMLDAIKKLQDNENDGVKTELISLDYAINDIITLSSKASDMYEPCIHDARHLIELKAFFETFENPQI